MTIIEELEELKILLHYWANTSIDDRENEGIHKVVINKIHRISALSHQKELRAENTQEMERLQQVVGDQSKECNHLGWNIDRKKGQVACLQCGKVNVCNHEWQRNNMTNMSTCIHCGIKVDIQDEYLITKR